ncbi:hypothetical protein IWZ00DRAFT_296888 [Phyllosticta capitalensis]|uniref:uncharacterized protein n=1 Tax=Phyllosticta capitalensis TaxID=121624 RepID=UPI0031300015
MADFLINRTPFWNEHGCMYAAPSNKQRGSATPATQRHPSQPRRSGSCPRTTMAATRSKGATRARNHQRAPKSLARVARRTACSFRMILLTCPRLVWVGQDRLYPTLKFTERPPNGILNVGAMVVNDWPIGQAILFWNSGMLVEELRTDGRLKQTLEFSATYKAMEVDDKAKPQTLNIDEVKKEVPINQERISRLEGKEIVRLFPGLKTHYTPQNDLYLAAMLHRKLPMEEWPDYLFDDEIAAQHRRRRSLPLLCQGLPQAGLGPSKNNRPDGIGHCSVAAAIYLRRRTIGRAPPPAAIVFAAANPATSSRTQTTVPVLLTAAISVTFGRTQSI